MSQKKSLAGILKIPEAGRLQDLIAEKGMSPVLDRLGDPEKALRYIRANLCGSYLFARYVVPSYAAAVFGSLTAFPPVDDHMGRMLSAITDAVRGELFNNNIFGRGGECHAHYHDALEAYMAAGGDMAAVMKFMGLESLYGFKGAVESSALWSAGSVRYAASLLRCCDDPMALFILMPANEVLAPKVYARALASLSREKRFDAFRRFLERHVSLDEADHGPVALDWLELQVRKSGQSPARLREATEKVIAYVSGESTGW